MNFILHRNNTIIMQLINTPIVSSKYDILWEETTVTEGAERGKPVLIIVGGCTAESTEDAQLKKMLGACKLDAGQYNIIRLDEGAMVAWHQLREKLQPAIIFLIGVKPEQLGISAMFTLNAPNSFNDKTWLPTLSIQELEQNPEAKKQLWINGMKPVFVDQPIPAAQG